MSNMGRKRFDLLDYIYLNNQKIKSSSFYLSFAKGYDIQVFLLRQQNIQVTNCDIENIGFFLVFACHRVKMDFVFRSNIMMGFIYLVSCL